MQCLAMNQCLEKLPLHFTGYDHSPTQIRSFERSLRDSFNDTIISGQTLMVGEISMVEVRYVDGFISGGLRYHFSRILRISAEISSDRLNLLG